MGGQPFRNPTSQITKAIVNGGPFGGVRIAISETFRIVVEIFSAAGDVISFAASRGFTAIYDSSLEFPVGLSPQSLGIVNHLDQTAIPDSKSMIVGTHTNGVLSTGVAIAESDSPTAGVSLSVGGSSMFKVMDNGLGSPLFAGRRIAFFGSALGAQKATITGSRATATPTQQLLTYLAALGLITDSTTP